MKTRSRKIVLKDFFGPGKHVYADELDYYTIDKLCRINPDFKQFIQKTTKVLNAQDNYISDVKDSLQHFCDKGFSSVEEIEKYCEDNHIPC